MRIKLARIFLPPNLPILLLKSQKRIDIFKTATRLVARARPPVAKGLMRIRSRMILLTIIKQAILAGVLVFFKE
ncbi:unnamed protein product [marine sediment metagenome]|uniref:Uncharacterized protein n=1 Tax=marine sediment metagenome TaxID=412755 RepID=X1H7P1_9ZZZZ